MNSDLVYDFGLHKGEDTAFYLAKGFRVVAFEANPDLTESCRARFASEIAAGRLTIAEGAVAPASAGDTLTFFRNERSVWGTIDTDWVERNERFGARSRKITVQRIDVAEIIRKFGMPFYMKIDIEGADRLILEILASFTERPKYISIESTNSDFNEFVADCELLRGLGYGRFKAVQQEYIPGRRGRFRRLNGQSFDYVFPNDASGPFGEEIDQEWLGYDKLMQAYRDIYRKYRWLGAGSVVSRIPGLNRLLWHVGKWTNTGLPGWYDTHAVLQGE